MHARGSSHFNPFHFIPPHLVPLQGNYSDLLVSLSTVYSKLRGDTSGTKNEDAAQVRHGHLGHGIAHDRMCPCSIVHAALCLEHSQTCIQRRRMRFVTPAQPHE